MKISKERIYFIYEKGKVKEFIITDVKDGVVVKGYIKGENKVHSRGISWFQEDPEKLKKKYRSAIKYYKIYGNKRVGILREDFPGLKRDRIKREVVIINIDRNFRHNTSRCLVDYIQSDGIVSSADINWFTNLK